GETVGFADYTAFMATEKYIRDNPATVQAWTDAVAKGMKWTAAASAADIAKSLEPFFPGVNPQALLGAAQRYQRLKIWKSTPAIAPPAWEKSRHTRGEGHALDRDKREKSQALGPTTSAEKEK